MAKTNNHSLLNWVKWDLRLVLGLLVLLGLVATWAFALPSGTPDYTLDFGTGVSGDVASGAISVAGGGSVYPQTSGSLKYGWASGTLIQAVTRGAAVNDRMLRDYNFSPGTTQTFKVSGLDAGDYIFNFAVGDNTDKVATKVTVKGKTTSIINTASYSSADIAFNVGGATDVIDINFAAAAGDAGWVINGIRIFKSTAPTPDPSFDVSLSPTTQTVSAGGIAEYSIGITPIAGYGSNITLSVSGLVAGITAELPQSTVTSLPATVPLRLVTQNNSTALPYEFLLSAKGGDAGNVSKSVVVKLTVTAGTTPDVSEPNQPDVQEPVVTPPVGEQTDRERAEQFDLIDDYVAAEADRIVNQNNVVELKDITNEFTGFPVVPDLPAPKTGFERSLQFLTRTGIIGQTVSNAPRGQEDDGPKSFFRRILDGIASPLGG